MRGRPLGDIALPSAEELDLLLTPEIARRVLAAILVRALLDLQVTGAAATSRKWLQDLGVDLAVLMGIPEETIRNAISRAKGYQALLFEVDE